jgi:hypothetical protein
MTDPRTEQPWYRRWYRQTIGVVFAMVLAIYVSQRDVPVAYQPVYRPVSNTQIELVQAYAVTSSYGVVELSAGLRSDGGSIPARTWSAIGLHPLSGCIIRGVLGHDGDYAAQLRAKEVADLALLECLLTDGCEPHKAEVIYQMVRDFGGFAWRGHSDEDVAAARVMVRIREQ